jgi:hypothetical protein
MLNGCTLGNKAHELATDLEWAQAPPVPTLHAAARKAALAELHAAARKAALAPLEQDPVKK